MEYKKKQSFIRYLQNEKGSILLPIILFFILLTSSAVVITTLSIEKVRHAEMMSDYYSKAASELFSLAIIPDEE
ncbi:hypothetical protein [Jeotgalibacillus terrae]|uniref:Flp pilus-assembly TadG-like N-terminal domain-containing protein n=1 Tax=Jeotgalibacillus terrae TaxID=587735 RepID=A0ABW5ZJM8_9BACL|nr:hypothetical protein [Jeotgalibacillus terrae]MBM7577573.1 hypothetical protein [Jeotgalibacillus terrae]